MITRTNSSFIPKQHQLIGFWQPRWTAITGSLYKYNSGWSGHKP